MLKKDKEYMKQTANPLNSDNSMNNKQNMTAGNLSSKITQLVLTGPCEEQEFKAVAVR